MQVRSLSRVSWRVSSRSTLPPYVSFCLTATERIESMMRNRNIYCVCFRCCRRCRYCCLGRSGNRTNRTSPLSRRRARSRSRIMCCPSFCGRYLDLLLDDVVVRRLVDLCVIDDDELRAESLNLLVSLSNFAGKAKRVGMCMCSRSTASFRTLTDLLLVCLLASVLTCFTNVSFREQLRRRRSRCARSSTSRGRPSGTTR